VPTRSLSHSCSHSDSHSHLGWDSGAGFEWHPERPLELLLWGPSGAPSQGESRPEVDLSTTGGESALDSVQAPAEDCESTLLRHVRLHWETACPLGVAASGRGSVAAVVDGARVLVTDFSSAVIPPPMCGRELCLPAPVRTFALLPPPPTPTATSRGHPSARNEPTAEGGGSAEGDLRGEGKLVAVLADGSVCLVTGPGASGVSEEEEEDLWEEMQEGIAVRERAESGTPAQGTSFVASKATGEPANGAGVPVGFWRTETLQLALRSIIHEGVDSTPAKPLPSSCLQFSQHICWLSRDSVLISLASADARLLLYEASAGAGAHQGQLPVTGCDTQGSVLVEVVLGRRGRSPGGLGTGQVRVPRAVRTPQGVPTLSSVRRQPNLWWLSPQPHASIQAHRPPLQAHPRHTPPPPWCTSGTGKCWRTRAGTPLACPQGYRTSGTLHKGSSGSWGACRRCAPGWPLPRSQRRQG